MADDKELNKKLKYWASVSEYRYSIRDRDPDDEWDAGEYGLDANANALARSERSGWEWNLIAASWDTTYGADEIDPGDPAHVVFVEYTTGSTFGSEGAWCIAAIKADLDEANEIVKLCEKDDTKEYRPWDGYFERLKSVSVTTLTVQA